MGVSASFINRSIINNAGHWGGGIKDESSTGVFYSNLLISGNTANRGSGIFIQNDLTDPILENCTISGNITNAGGYPVEMVTGSNLTLINSIIWDDQNQVIFDEIS